jgi:hypothetical protein
MESNDGVAIYDALLPSSTIDLYDLFIEILFILKVDQPGLFGNGNLSVVHATMLKETLPANNSKFFTRNSCFA